jgi:hypothetical protein
VGTALSGSYLAFSASPTLPVAAGLALAVLAEIASSVPIPPNINIVVRLLLLLLLVTSKNEINNDLDTRSLYRERLYGPIFRNLLTITRTTLPVLKSTTYTAVLATR